MPLRILVSDADFGIHLRAYYQPENGRCVSTEMSKRKLRGQERRNPEEEITH